MTSAHTAWCMTCEGGSCSCDFESVERELQPPADWPEGLTQAFWSAVNAPTYAESSALTLKFVHELAEDARKFMGPRAYPGEPERVTRYAAGWHDAIDRIDPKGGR